MHQYATVLKLFARWGARGRRYWPASPLADYQPPGFVETDIVPFTRDELAALLAACGPDTTFMGRRLRSMLLVALDTGMRRGELRGLTVPIWTRHRPRPAAGGDDQGPPAAHGAPAAGGPGGRPGLAGGARRPPGCPRGRGPLFCELRGAALSDGAMHRLAVRLRARSGVARFRWHLLRHTAGTESLRNGADSIDVQEALGHATPMMTRRYLHLTDDDRRERHARYSPVEALLEPTPSPRRPRGPPPPPGRPLRERSGAAPAAPVPVPGPGGPRATGGLQVLQVAHERLLDLRRRPLAQRAGRPRTGAAASAAVPPAARSRSISAAWAGSTSATGSTAACRTSRRARPEAHQPSRYWRAARS